MLHPPIYDERGRVWCGPTAIAAISGLPVSKIHRMIRRYRNKTRRFYGIAPYQRKTRPRGMGDIETLAVLDQLGYRPINRFHRHKDGTPYTPGAYLWRKSLREFCLDRGHYGPFLIQLHNHYVTVSHGMICDSFTKVPIPWREYPRLKRLVMNFWQFKPKGKRHDREIGDHDRAE